MEKRKNITSKIKVEIVLSLLRGEDPELVSREYGVTLADINLWRDQFIESGADGFKRKPDDSKLIAAERKIGQLQMELELTKKERIGSKTKKEMISILINERYPLTGKPYPKRLIFKVVGYSSSTWYENPTPKTGKRGRKPKHSDEEVLQEIKKEIKKSKFNSEGYIKVKNRMAKRKINALVAGKARVNRIMRENSLLSPYRRPGKTNKREHDGTIITDAPNVMWATDGKKFWIEGSGWHWFFGVIDHFNDEIISWHIAKKGNRFAAMQPVRAAVRKTFGTIDKNVCTGMKLQLRSDHGSQYDSADFMNEMKYLGLEMSKAFVRSPQCNGIIERFHRTLEEQVLQVETFTSFEEAYNSIDQFIKDYNTDWIFHRLNYCSPVEYREKYAESLRKEKDNIPSGNKDPEVQLVLISSGSMPRRNERAEQEIIKGETTISNNPLEILRYNISPSDQLVRYKSNKKD